MLRHGEFVRKYNTHISARSYGNITRAIQRYLDSDDGIVDLLVSERPVLNINSTRFLMASGRFIDISKAKSKIYYPEFLLYKSGFPTAQTMWLNRYNVNEEIFQKSQIKTKQATSEPELIALQFKIIHNILNTGENLKKWGIQEHETCCMCDTNTTDSIVHALANCQWTVNSIRILSKSIKCLDKIKQVDKTSFLFGVDDQSLNNIILVIKLMLHRFRQKKAPIQEDVFKKELYKRIISDKHVVTQKNFEKNGANMQNWSLKRNYTIKVSMGKFKLKA